MTCVTTKSGQPRFGLRCFGVSWHWRHCRSSIPKLKCRGQRLGLRQLARRQRCRRATLAPFSSIPPQEDKPCRQAYDRRGLLIDKTRTLR